eukprot:m.409859 g.409859  ORF g.409859 m.409859 type:complete len:385 (-) comp56523_c0_seq1:128-1282(-)
MSSEYSACLCHGNRALASSDFLSFFASSILNRAAGCVLASQPGLAVLPHAYERLHKNRCIPHLQVFLPFDVPLVAGRDGVRRLLHLVELCSQLPTANASLNFGEQLNVAGFAAILEVEEHSWAANENLAAPKRLLRFRHANVIENHFSAELVTRLEDGPRARGQHLVSLKEALEVHSERVSCSTHAHVLHQTKIANLVLHKFNVEQLLLLGGIGFDAPNVVRILRRQILHQFSDRSLELSGERRRTLLAVACHFPFLEQGLHQRVRAAVHELRQIHVKNVAILVEEAVHVVGHVACVVTQPERIAGERAIGQELLLHARLKVLVVHNLRRAVENVKERFVRHVSRAQAGVIEKGKNGCTVSLNELADNLVVKVVDVCPRNALQQ